MSLNLANVLQAFILYLMYDLSTITILVTMILQFISFLFLGGGASNSSSLSKPHHTTSESSESEDSSSDDSSSDEDINRPNKKVKNTSNKPGPGNNSSSDKSGNRKSAVPKQPHQVPTPLEAPDDVDLGTSFSLTNLLTKVRKRIGIGIGIGME